MAHPSSSHRDNDRDTTTHRHRTSSSAHHHHRTISSTTLLLVLSLILAVLAVMLSLPSRHSTHTVKNPIPIPSASGAHPDVDHEGTSAGFWGYLTPKRSHALVSRESNIAIREAEVARREAEILAGAPGGIAVCPPCLIEEELTPSVSLVARSAPPPPPPAPPVQVTTVEVDNGAPAWMRERMDNIVDREMKISNREKDVGTREEAIGKREADATKREAWIMEQLLHLQPDRVEEEYIYEHEHEHDHPRHYYGEARRPSPPKELPILAPTSTIVHTSTVIHTQTVLPPPAATRVAAHPAPEEYVETPTRVSPDRTKEVFVEVPEPTPAFIEEDDDIEEVYYRTKPKMRSSKKWFGSQW